MLRAGIHKTDREKRALTTVLVIISRINTNRPKERGRANPLTLFCSFSLSSSNSKRHQYAREP
jgi:hypothetical protein